MAIVNISGLDHAAVFAALYNVAKPQGIGFLHYTPEPIDAAEAASMLASNKTGYFDYVRGRVMKIKLAASDTEIDTRLFDRDNGVGSAADAIDAMVGHRPKGS